ncbi:DNA translocase FtsK, partial [Acinetobacter baumannii]|nr:DNA translocase FtsK [Acinetobacter baumannii]
TDEEVERIANECSSQGAPFYDDAFIRLEGVNDGEGGGGLDVSDDPLYAEVKDYVIDVQKASTSLLQRRF